MVSEASTNSVSSSESSLSEERPPSSSKRTPGFERIVPTPSV